MKLSLRLSSDLEPEPIREGARGAVAAGLERVWLADNPRERSSIVTAAHLAALEPSLSIGLGIVSARERNPIVLAQEALALQGYCPQGVILGLGLGDSREIGNLGLAKRSGLALLRETTQIVRALSQGDEIPALGDDGAGTVGLKFTGRPLPVYFGAIGPKTLRLAGEIADGVVLSLGTTARAARTAVTTALEAERAPGLAPTVETVCYVAFGGLDDAAADRMQMFAAHVLKVFFAQPGLEVLLEGTGVGPQEAAGLVADYEHGVPLPAEVVDAISIAGSVEHCIERMRAYQSAGVNEIALGLGLWNSSFADALADAARLSAAWKETAEWT
ncbi:LLM class flavin-dependent oxidoreductase [Nocardioides terrisoli]|uniref:LLM class flavin-dependent oxidoreductase n=1 Tax=Nocardioides terrisoli TaxID=3388267 RepID=UPI00287BBBA7|nr:LLM class flavin-dependent oxidoreductase [Nocardioides marmorisolisilvae]